LLEIVTIFSYFGFDNPYDSPAKPTEPMNYIADLHIHSHYSRATSRKLDPENLFIWAQRKGVQVLGSGDLSHPQWLAEMREKLEPSPTADGFYELKPSLAKTLLAEVPAACRAPVHFILSGEISSIYKKDGEVRKVHNVIFFPSFESVQKFQDRLDRIGNIRSDGRPILGLDSRHLLEIVLETDPRGVLIPAHIWTPWFSLLGSQSGFDSVEACFDDLTRHIFALETGLSSDPPMNWRLTQLDRYNLISNSDAHSPENLAREANVFTTELSYDSLFAALREKNHPGFWGTLEFFPEEGKYHMDGHRKCNRMMRPAETVRNNGLCPVCGKPAVLGVSYRVEELADCEEGRRPADAKSFSSIVPLMEVLAEVMAVGVTSKKVRALYDLLQQKLGAELTILRDCPLDEIGLAGGPLTREAIRRMRDGEVDAQPGYDGEFGVIRLFRGDDREKILQANPLFEIAAIGEKAKPAVEEKIKPPRRSRAEAKKISEESGDYGLNPEQEEAVRHHGAPLIIQAGPGTGKTRVLTHWLARLLRNGLAAADQVLAITFTNKAAAELRDRLRSLLAEDPGQAPMISTFHGFGLHLLRQTPAFFARDPSFRIIAAQDDPAFLADLEKKCGRRIPANELERISLIKGRLFDPDTLPPSVSAQLGQDFLTHFRSYESLLAEKNAVDLDDLIGMPVRLLRNDPEWRRTFLQRYTVIAVDEFQDINQAQYELFRIFAIAASQVCVIGDPDQSIYGFRGASPQYFGQLMQDLPNHRFIRLSRNYRSSQNILDASGQVLGRSASDLHSGISAEIKIQVRQAVSDHAEAEQVVKTIEELLSGTTSFSMDSGRVARGLETHGYAFGDMAILLRSKNLLPPLMEALTRAGIPYETIQEQPLSNDPYVRFVLATFTYLLDRSQAGLKAVAGFFLHDEVEILHWLESQTEPATDRALFPGSSAWYRLTSFLRAAADWSAESTVSQLLASIRQWSPVAAEQETTFKKLETFAAGFDNRLQAFCDALLLQKGMDDWDPRADRVRILTMHAAKGLEFPVVFIIGCEEGIIPFAFGAKTLEVEEEKRLFYVAMTRSKRHLYLSWAQSRWLQGQRHVQSPSRFLSAISDKLLQRCKEEKKTKKGAGQMKLF